MKNRLEVARRLLKDDGVIFVQCDDNEQAYLKVLMDEVFSSNNYLNTILIKAKANAGASGGGEDKRFKKNYEFLLIYAKNYSLVNYQNINKQKVGPPDIFPTTNIPVIYPQQIQHLYHTDRISTPERSLFKTNRPNI